MNQGSLSCAGSYGVSGLSKISGALTAYVGNTTASSSKELCIDLSVIEWAGVEYINFNDLDASGLLAGLQSNPKIAAQNALEAFVAVYAAKKNKTPDADNLMTKWVNASNAFYENFGAGIVVGIVWGGWGTVKLVFTANADESKWEGGGTMNFSYAGEGTAVDVAATYGHTQDSIDEKAGADLTCFYNGDCVKDDTQSWFNDLNKSAQSSLDSLGKEPVSRASASTGGTVKPPSIPEFIKPKPEKKITDLFTQIDSLQGLEAYAQAAAFEKQKKDGGTERLVLVSGFRSGNQ